MVRSPERLRGEVVVTDPHEIDVLFDVSAVAAVLLAHVCPVEHISFREVDVLELVITR